MTTVSCLPNLGVGGDASLSQPTLSIITCGGNIGVHGDFHIFLAPLATKVPLSGGVGISGQIWGGPATIILSLEVNQEQAVDAALLSGPVKAVNVITQVGGDLPLTSPAITPGRVDLTVLTAAGGTMGLRCAPAILPVNVSLAANLKQEGSLYLVSRPQDVVTVLSPVNLGIACSFGLEVPRVIAREVSSLVTMQVGGNFGLVGNAVPVTVVLLNGGTAVDGAFLAALQAETVETWVLTGNTFNPSVYTGWGFNSFARFQGRDYAAGPGGIYLLEGADDDGQPIRPGMRLVSNFGNEKHKRIRSLHLGKCGDKAQVRVVGADKEDVFEPDDHDHRAVISRDIEAQEFLLDIIDFTQLSQCEIAVLPLVKR